MRIDTIPNRVAVIDVGSNTIKLLVAEANGDKLTSLKTSIEECRISKGMNDAERLLTDEAVKNACLAIQNLLEIAEEFKPSQIRIVATSAVRDAKNQKAFLDRAQTLSGHPVAVLSGTEEAISVGRALSLDSQIPRNSSFIHFDLGGGSLEYNHISVDKILKAESMPLGSVRLNQRFVKNPHQSITTEEKSKIEHAVISQFNQVGIETENDLDLVITGGASTLLRSMFYQCSFSEVPDTPSIITREMLESVFEQIDSSNWEERLENPFLPQNRADVMPVALLILMEILDVHKKAYYTHSLNGLRHGVAAELLNLVKNP